MEKIIPLITTPFALAALVILVFGGVYQVAKRKKQIDRKVFWLILVFGVLGNANYLINNYAFSDAVVRGNVRDPNGKPIDLAIINISPVGRAVTNHDGNFELSVPYSRQQKSYEIYPLSTRYAAERKVVSGPKPAFVSLELTAREAKISDLFDVLDVINTFQNVGDPLLAIGFKIHDSLDIKARLSSIVITLNTPSGNVVQFYPFAIQRNEQVYQYSELLLDSDQARAAFNYFLSPNPNRINALFADAQRKFGPNWTYDCSATGELRDSQIVEFLQKSFDATFFWVSGKYEATVTFRLDDKNYDQKYTFVLTPEDVKKLRSMRERLNTCHGMALGVPWLPTLIYSDSTASNFVWARASALKSDAQSSK